ncbi:Ribonuclease H2, subunit B [Kalmanozyma brasiliensis GHG001]|uniref:Ribonuclease H2 subunit B n=1 Tax=Kalmanozyma brasiliensis (strain GHG001) TaxID=1365824 RepID=V5EU03_KALBG|nr:Ribonuclease H2, subunit B [Kalmanozyma brasiliensis GHG001]EST06563.1 Ribonuclease H2, subunit B [Kalmanozyma brasiliensis GHG001]
MTATHPTPSQPTAETRSMRTGVLIHPSHAQSGRFLVLPHPRTLVPTYYLSLPSSSSSAAGLLELTTLQDTRYSRSWMLSHLNQVLSSGQLEILAPVDVRFLLISLLSLLSGGYRSVEDCFEQVALDLWANRKEALSSSVPEVKAAEGGMEEVWSDVVAFGNLDGVQEAMRDVCDTQTLPTGDQAFRLSQEKTFALLNTKLARLSERTTFVQAPNTLGRSFERRWTSDSDPTPYLTTEAEDCDEAKKLRSRIAAEVIATNLPPKLAAEYFAHLGISLD